jgi:hypothetical protein
MNADSAEKFAFRDSPRQPARQIMWSHELRRVKANGKMRLLCRWHQAVDAAGG